MSTLYLPPKRNDFLHNEANVQKGKMNKTAGEDEAKDEAKWKWKPIKRKTKNSWEKIKGLPTVKNLINKSPTTLTNFFQHVSESFVIASSSILLKLFVVFLPSIIFLPSASSSSVCLSVYPSTFFPVGLPSVLIPLHPCDVFHLDNLYIYLYLYLKLYLVSVFVSTSVSKGTQNNNYKR